MHTGIFISNRSRGRGKTGEWEPRDRIEIKRGGRKGANIEWK